ncbi:WS/DGAT domain-containing protein, partial [Jatrophihabitans sp.]|uniref:WS/DGAT domain-containing protein n=1 Tax=Jatrophihabitans sp. TaxID=1932789 RepID=UPI0030C695BC|nr:Diacylglycerol O-acyltransferase [Jatrophihabitans sp.]
KLLAGASRGLLRYATAARPVSKSSLVGRLESSRAFGWVSADLAEVSTVRHALGGSINDVVLAMVTRAFRDTLIARGEWPGPHSLRSLVPVSVRLPGDRSGADNRISALLADLPVHLERSSDAYRSIVEQTQQLKSSHEAVAGELIGELADLLPPRLTASALRAAFRVPQRFITTVTTNVPGPRWPLYLLGRRMTAIYPYVPLADRLRVGIAVTSYDGGLYFGITSDRDSVPNLDTFKEGLLTGLQDLLSEAENARASI